MFHKSEIDQVGLSLFFFVLTESIHLECFYNASFLNLREFSSQAGFIFLADENDKRCPVM